MTTSLIFWFLMAWRDKSIMTTLSVNLWMNGALPQKAEILPVASEKRRCRLHGGASGSGGPLGRVQ
jgi:hypothetical protein